MIEALLAYQVKAVYYRSIRAPPALIYTVDVLTSKGEVKKSLVDAGNDEILAIRKDKYYEKTIS